MQAETCSACGRPVKMMCQQGTGFCSENCRDSYANVHSYIGTMWERLMERVS